MQCHTELFRCLFKWCYSSNSQVLGSCRWDNLTLSCRIHYCINKHLYLDLYTGLVSQLDKHIFPGWSSKTERRIVCTHLSSYIVNIHLLLNYNFCTFHRPNNIQSSTRCNLNSNCRIRDGIQQSYHKMYKLHSRWKTQRSILCIPNYHTLDRVCLLISRIDSSDQSDRIPNHKHHKRIDHHILNRMDLQSLCMVCISSSPQSSQPHNLIEQISNFQLY